MQYLPSDPWSQANQRVDTGPGAALAGIGNVFGDPLQNALQQQKQALTAREIAGQGQLGQLFAHPGAIDNSTAAAAIANGMTPDAVGQALRLTNNLNGGVDSDLAARAATGIGAYNSTPLSQQRAEAAKMAETTQASQIAAQAQLRTAGLDPVQIVNPDGSVGWTTKAAIATGGAPKGATPLISPDMVKGALAGHNLLPQPGGGAVAPQAAPDAAPAAPVAAPAPQSAPFDPSSPTASIAGLLGSAMPQPAAPAPSGVVSAPPAPDPSTGAPTGDAMSDDQKQFLGISPAPVAPKFQVTGEDAFGNKVYGYPPSPPAAGAAPAAASPVATPGEQAQALNLHGADFLQTLDPQTAGQVQSIIDGRTPYPTGMLLKTPYGQKLAAFVTQADPSFEAGNATARVKARQDFTAGGPNSVAGTILAGNTALSHMGAQSDQVAGLGNYNAPFGATIVNGVKNAVNSTGAAGAPLATFNAINGRLAEEMTKFYRGTGGTEADVERDMANISPNMTPTQLNAGLAALAKLTQGKLDALQARWHNAMGPMVPDFPITTPEAQHAMDTVMGRAGGAQGGVANPPAIPTLPGVTAPREAPAFAPSGPKVGDVVKGHVYKGGDPGVKESWQKVPG